MATEDEKEKPAYTVWQNSAHVIARAWERDRSVLYVILAQILLTVVLSTVALYLPKTVVAQITTGVSVGALARTILVFTGVIVVLQAVKSYLDTTAGPRRTGLRARVCQDILSKAMTTDYANLEDKAFTDAKQKAHDITDNNSASTEQIYYCFVSLGTNVLGFVVYVILLVAVNPLVLLVTAATTIAGALVRRWANRWRHDHDDELAAYNKRLWYLNNVGVSHEMAKDIRLFAMTDWLHSVHAANMRLAFDFGRRAQTKQLIADVVDCVATFAREGIAYGYLIWQVLYLGLSVDNFLLLFAAISGFSGWITGILVDYSALSMHSLNYCRLRAYLEYPDTFKRREGEHVAPAQHAPYALELRGVSFRYRGANESTLENINLTITPGERLAVVGLNGAGKTTLVKLLCGFYDPTEGTVLLNGRDIRRFNREEYYTLLTAVFQEFNILPLSIAQNITQQWDGYDGTRLDRCLALADLSAKIGSLPSGLSSLLVKSVHNNAIEFSGGETQRMMLARALYKDSPVIILDEPTAALDPIAESRLYDRYSELSGGKTSVYISHRLASTRFCDRIILIDNKTIAECGTHEELLRLGGKYAELFRIQSKYYQTAKEGEPR
ncbi:MAG: ABC transporter ATP-binding protein [Actinobacteria bacterium]|nr:ABC transporter ATP-binding protein [Actinomycetota bacterium]